jgi:AraC family transcriptional regulator
VLPEPRFSSVAKGWRGVILEMFSNVAADFTALFDNHNIAVHLNGCIDVHQRFEGKSARMQMRRGSLTINPAGAPKAFQHQGGGDFLVVHVAPSLLQGVAEQVAGRSPGDVELVHAFSVKDARIERLAHRLWEEYRSKDVASGICAEAIATLLAVQLLRNHSTLARIANPSRSRLSPQALKKAIDYIDAHLCGDLTLADVAGAVKLSTSHFAHAFKNATGMAPHQYVIEQRVALARTLLRETELPIANVAAQSGFSTHAHFSVSFQRLTGMTPRAFRQRR